MKISKLILFLFSATVLVSCSKDDTNEGAVNPSSFNLLFVSNNATNVSFTPTFTWEESSGPNGESVTYDLYIQKANEVPNSSLPTQLHKSGITTNTYTVTSPLLATTQYKWYVKAKISGGGDRNSSSTFSFITADIQNLPPNPFDLVSPFDNETDVPSDPILSWQAATDPENDPIVYDIYLGENVPVRIGAGVQATTLPVGSLLPNTTYFWYVQALDTAGNGVNSSIFSFTTGDDSSGGNGNYTLISNNAIANQVGRRGHQMINYNGKIWIIGGLAINDDGSGGEYNDVWNSSDGGNTWNLVKENTAPPEGFTPSEEHQAVVFRNEIWVLNGNRNTTHKSSDGITWETVSFSGSVSDGTHYGPRNQFQAVVFYDMLYLIGGLASGITQNDVWSTNGIPDANGHIEWILETDNAGFSPRYGHQAVVFKDKIILTGGLSGLERRNDIWSSTNGVNWTLVSASAPFTERTEHVMEVQSDGDVLWLFGGNGIDPNTGISIDSLNDAWVTDDGETWLELEPHISDDSGSGDFKGRQEFDCIAIDGEIVIYGGKNGTSLLNDIWFVPNF